MKRQAHDEPLPLCYFLEKPVWSDEVRAWRPGEALKNLLLWGLATVVCIGFVLLISLAGS